MKKPTFFVGRPDDWIKRRPERMLDVVPFYKTLLSLLKEGGYTYTLGKNKHAPLGYDICLAHHTKQQRPNLWNIKKGYFPGLLNWDRKGYSGWAEMASSTELFQMSQAVNLTTATEQFNKFANEYISTNNSKFPQQNDSPLDVKKPYVFVACQRHRDTVARWARVDTLTLAQEVAEAFRGSEYEVVVKVHPMEKQFDTEALCDDPNVTLSDHSIHSIIPNSSAVFTVNSGVGLEALLHMKPVYTSGKSDYEWVTRNISNVREIHKLSNAPIPPISIKEQEVIIKFVHYITTEHFVNAFDRNSIQKKIDMSVNEWRNT